MAFARKASWLDWFREMFLQQGLFSLRPVPTTRAEDAQSAATAARAQSARPHVGCVTLTLEGQ